jgi:multidrug efflux pump
MNLSAPFVRRPIGTILLTIGVALAGVAAFFNLPVSPLPQVDFPTIAVQATLPGASPETMATSVATPLERHLGLISDVTQMTSSSRTSVANIVLQFGLDRNIDGAARDVQAAINAARIDLPSTLRTNPTYVKVNPADTPILVLALTSTTRTPGQIYDAASNIVQQQLSQVKGVGDVGVGGASLPAVRVELNPLALARYGVGLEDVRAALASANANRPKGVIEDGPQRLQIYTNDAGTTAADYAPLLVAYRNGSAVRLSDIAQVVDGQEDVRNQGVFVHKADGKPVSSQAVIVTISRQPGANIISTVDRVKARLPAVKRALPQDIDMQVAVDRTTTIRASLNDVERTVVIATILVVGVVAFFLMNGVAVLIPSVAVAVSLLGSLGVMFLLGFSLDNLSLMALTISTGFVVDDAIVVLENVTRHVEQGMDRFQAALRGAQEVGFTVVSISISLIAVFVPILLMGGIYGRILREFAITLSAAVLISLAISLTTTPMMAAYLVTRPRPGVRRNWFERISEASVDAMRRFYERALDLALDSGPVILVIIAAAVVLNGYLYTIVPKGFFPQEDTGMMVGGLVADQSSSFQITQRRLKQFVNIIGSDPAVKSVVAFVGGASGRGGASAFMLTTLSPKAERHMSTIEVMGRLRPKLAQVTGASLFLAPVQDLRIGGRQSNATYQYTLEAESLKDLRAWATKLRDAMQNQWELEDVNYDQQDHGLQSYVNIDENKAAALGLTNLAIDNTLYDAFGQRDVSTIYRDVNQYHVVMEVAPQYAQDPTVLSRVYVSSGKAAPTPPGFAAAQGESPIGVSSQVANATSLTSATSAETGGLFNPPAANVTPLTKAYAAGTGGAGVAVGVTTPGQVGSDAAVSGPGAPPALAASRGVAVSSSVESEVPLSAISQWADGSAPTSVNHQDTQPATTISFNLAEGTSLSDATLAIERAKAEVGLPASVHGKYAGNALAYQQLLSTLAPLIVAAIVAIYLVLGILYESYIHPLTVLSTLPSAGVGALVGLLLFHIELSLIAFIGIILLIGIVKKNAILMIDFALVAERERNLSPRQAIRQAALIRFRPIMMTTFAAILGAAPLAIGWGEGSELRQPLGVTIIGGLLVSQLLTLLTTPVVYLYLDRFRRRGEFRRKGRAPSPSPLPAE